MPAHSLLTADGYVRHDLADRLRGEIINGSLPGGVRIIEGKWAQKFGVAQGSVREAINILALDGFVTKESGRSARVIHLSERDVAQLYDICGAFEGLAAGLAAELRADLSKLQSAVDGMRRAANAGVWEALLHCDLQFHLQLCELSDNSYLVEQSRRTLLPFFAFVRMRVARSQSPQFLFRSVCTRADPACKTESALCAGDSEAIPAGLDACRTLLSVAAPARAQAPPARSSH
jgi:DNA-binding GntR family transcriptional regulator